MTSAAAVADTAGRPLRIGVAFHGDPEQPGSWSGTPMGFVRGLRALGHDVVGLSALASPGIERRFQQALALPRLPAELRRSHGDVRAALAPARASVRISPAYGHLGSALIRRALGRAGHLDLVVRMGTSFEVRHPRVVTFEDLTVPRVIEAGWEDWARLGERGRRARIVAQRRALAAARTCTTATPWTASSVIDDFGIDAAKVVPIGLGTNHTMPPAQRDWSRPRFLFVGKDWEDKNGPVLIEAFTRLHAEMPAATLDLVGHHPAIDRPGVTGHGFLRLADPAARATMTRLFQQATCLVVPTSFEPAGIVHVEAAAAGVPSIGSALGGARDMIGPSGVTVTPGSVDALVTAMRAMADPATAQQMGEAGRARAQLFTWESAAARLLQATGLAHREPALWEGLFPGPAPRLA